MSVALMLMLLSLPAGAVFAFAFEEFPAQRRIIVALCALSAAAGAALGLIRSTTGDGVAWRGFVADPIAALLVAGALGSSISGIARAGSGRRPGAAEAALFAATAAGLAPLLVERAHLIAVALPVSTLGLAVGAFVAGRGGGPDLRALRAIAGLAAADVAALVAIGSAVSSGTRTPPDLSVEFAALMLASACIRLGLMPVAWITEDATRAHPVVAALWLGPVRAHGLLLLLFAVSSHRGIAYAAAAAAAVTAAVAVLRARASFRIDTMSALGTALAVTGLAVGGAAAIWGAVLCLAATFAATAAWPLKGGWLEGVRPSAGALPAGALLPGATLVASAMLDAAVVRPGFLAFALPAIGACVALGATAWKGGRSSVVGARPLVHVWGLVAIAAAIGIAAVPTRVIHGLAFPVADALGVGRLLTPDAEPGVAEGLAFAMAAVALVAFVVGPGRAGTGGPPATRRTGQPAWMWWWGAAAPAPSGRSISAAARADTLARRWMLAAGVLIAASIGIALRVYVAASSRGFL